LTIKTPQLHHKKPSTSNYISQKPSEKTPKRRTKSTLHHRQQIFQEKEEKWCAREDSNF
jgi:hypothetical protein